MKKYTFYAHTTPAHKLYLGVTKLDPLKRWNNGEGYKNQPLFYEDIKLYGWDNMGHYIIKEGLSEEEAFKMEQDNIKQLKLTDPIKGYNIAPGGRTPWNKGKTGVYSEDTLEKMRQKATGRPSCRKGQHLSEEHKRAISLANKGQDNSQHNKPVICLELNKTFKSIREASIKLDVRATSISAVCKGRRKTTGGYHFIYKDTNFMEV